MTTFRFVLPVKIPVYRTHDADWAAVGTVEVIRAFWSLPKLSVLQYSIVSQFIAY
jgi:hypothetical protein